MRRGAFKSNSNNQNLKPIETTTSKNDKDPLPIFKLLGSHRREWHYCKRMDEQRREKVSKRRRGNRNWPPKFPISELAYQFWYYEQGLFRLPNNCRQPSPHLPRTKKPSDWQEQLLEETTKGEQKRGGRQNSNYCFFILGTGIPS